MTYASNPHESNSSLQSYLRYLRAMRRAQSTIDCNRYALAQFVGHAAGMGVEAPHGVTRAVLTDYLVWMHDRYRAHTVRVRYSVVRSWFRWLVEEGDLEANPCLGVPLPYAEQVAKDVVAPADLARVFGALEKEKRWRDLAILAILYDTGMRVGELIGLRKADIDLDTGLTTISRSSTKTAAGARVVRLSPAAIRHVDRYFRRRSDAHPWAIVGHKGQMNRSGVYMAVRDVFARSGVQGTIGPHDLRHTSASHVAGMMSESEMMLLYGWREPDMARYYAREAMRQAALEAHTRVSPMEQLATRGKR